MYKKVLVAGVTAAAIIGSGATALAATGSNTATGTSHVASASATKAGHAADKKAKHRFMRRIVHGQFVVRRHGDFVTLDLNKGTVTSVSASSITVQSRDNVSQTFKVGTGTKVFSRADHKRHHSSIGKVSNGDRVRVIGLGASGPTALRILDRGTK